MDIIYVGQTGTGFKLAVAKLLKSPRPIKMYETKIEEGKVLVNI